jgi:tripartite-type tricarboxylate transporter receptor subunit TctC
MSFTRLFDSHSLGARCAAAALIATGLAAGPAHAAWEPSKPVEFIVPAGTGAVPTRWRA